MQMQTAKTKTFNPYISLSGIQSIWSNLYGAQQEDGDYHFSVPD